MQKREKKLKPSLYVKKIMRYIVKAYGGAHVFSISPLVGGEWSITHPGHINPLPHSRERSPATIG
jgi:hypothetical protein